MAAEAPLKKEIGEGGFEARDSQGIKSGLEKLSAEWKVMKGGAEEQTESHVQKAKSWKERIFSLFKGKEVPASVNDEFEKNTSAAEESLEKLKQAAAELLEEKTQEKVDLKAESAALFERLKGKPAQKMVEELYAYKEKISQSDEYGQIGDVQFDENRGQIRVEYADGGSLRKFPHGLVLRVHEGGEIETLESPFKPKKPTAAPKPAEVVAPATSPEKPRRDPKETLKALENAKTPAMLRAAIMKNKHVNPEELALLSDAELETMRLKVMDEIDGGNREVTAEIEAEAGEEILTFAQKLEAQKPADKAKLLAGAEKADAEEGPNADVRLMNEAELTKEFDRLSSLVAIEGAKGSKAWAEALKSGIEPETSKAGKRLNVVQRRLNEFRTEQPMLLTPADIKKKKSTPPPPAARIEASDAVVVEEETDWDQAPKDAHQALEALDAAQTPAELRTFLAEGGYFATEDLDAMTDDAVEAVRAKVKDDIASKGGIVMGTIGYLEPKLPPPPKSADAKKKSPITKLKPFVPPANLSIPEAFIDTQETALAAAKKAQEDAEAVTGKFGPPPDIANRKRVRLTDDQKAELLKSVADAQAQKAETDKVGPPPGVESTPATTPEARKTNWLDPEVMKSVVVKMDELGHADTYKKINKAEKLMKILGESGFDVGDLGSAMEESIYKNWKKAQEKHNKDKAKGSKP